MLARDRTFAIRVGKYQSNDIKEASFDYGYIKGDTFKPGGTCAGSAKVTFTSIITTFKKLDKVYPEIGLLVGNTYEWVKMGEYFINDIEIDRNRNLTTLDLMDGMFKFNKPFESGLSYPAQIRDVIREICVKAGVTLQTDNFGIRAIQHHVLKKPDKKDVTYREVLSQAVQLLGFSAFFNRDGKLEIRGLTESNITITADSYFLHGLTKSEIEYQIAGITCKKSEKEVLTVGLSTGRSLELENSFMSQNILNALYDDLKNLKFYPFNLNYQGHLKLQVGQWVTIKTNKNETFKVPVLSQSFKFQGGLSARISADSKAGNDAQYSYGGFYARRIQQANTDMAAEVQQQLGHAESEFNKQTEQFKGEVKNGIDKAKNESQAYADRIGQVVAGKVQEVNQLVIANKAEQDNQYRKAIAKAGASSDLAKQAQNLATQVRDDLNKVKQTTTQAQAQADFQIEQVKKDVGAIRTQQTVYEQNNEQSLVRITGQLGDKASKAEVKQTADGIREEIASLSVGGRNLIGAFNTHCVKSTFDIDTYRFSGKTDKNTNTNSLQLQFLWTDGSYTSIISINTLGAFRKAFKIKKPYKEFIIKYNSNKEDAKLICRDPELLKLNEDYLFTGWLINLSPNDSQVDLLKIERGTISSDWSKAPEDTDGFIIATKTSFERTAQSLRTDLASVQAYVNSDGIRTEALRTYSREETARQVSSLRQNIESDYVAKAQHTEDVRGLTNRFEELKSSSEAKLAEYKQSVDGRFATVTSQLNNKANKTDFQKVQETTKLYERIIGSSESDVVSKVSKMVMSNSLFQVEVSKNQELKTVQTQLAGSWAVQNINSAGDLISGLNLGANGVNRLDGRLTHITGETLIDNAVIKSAMIDKLKTANFESGSVTTQILASGSVTADKLVVDQAFFNKLSSNEAYLKQLFAKQAFITQVQSVELSATKIKGGILTSLDGGTTFNLADGSIIYTSGNPVIKRVSTGYEKGEISINNFSEQYKVYKAKYTTIDLLTTEHSPTLTGNDRQAYLRLISNKALNNHHVHIKADEIILAFNNQLKPYSVSYVSLGYLLHEIIGKLFNKNFDYQSLINFYNENLPSTKPANVRVV